MVVVPEVRPETTPDVLMPATEVALLLHEPPVVASVNVVVLPGQTEVEPAIAAGAPVTVTVSVELPQPLA